MTESIKRKMCALFSAALAAIVIVHAAGDAHAGVGRADQSRTMIILNWTPNKGLAEQGLTSKEDAGVSLSQYGGRQAIRFAYKGGERTEVSVQKGRPMKMGGEYWFAFRTAIPNPTGEIFFQVHRTPNDWQDNRSEEARAKKVYKNPPIAMYATSKDSYRIGNKWYVGKNGVRKSWNTSVDSEDWTTWVIQMRVSTGEGLFRIWKNGQFVGERQGPTYYPEHKDGPYIKLGLYKPSLRGGGGGGYKGEVYYGGFAMLEGSSSMEKMMELLQEEPAEPEVPEELAAPSNLKIILQ